jgi:hypothetical protein
MPVSVNDNILYLRQLYLRNRGMCKFLLITNNWQDMQPRHAVQRKHLTYLAFTVIVIECCIIMDNLYDRASDTKR